MYDIINIWLDDEYGLASFSDIPHTLVDVGANVGLFSLWAWHHFPEANILSYEPNPRILSYAQKNLHCTNARLLQCGVSDQDGKCHMIDEAASRLASTKKQSDGDIELRSMDKVVKDAGGEIDLLKLDCEGAEWEIFRAKDALRCVKAIRLEYHLTNNRSITDLYAAVLPLGFTIHYLRPYKDHGIAWLVRDDPQWL